MTDQNAALSSVIDTVMAEAVPAATPDPTPAPEAAPVETAPTDSVPAQTPTPTASLTDEALVEVIIDGKPVQMTWADARKNISHTAASTQRFQQAAEIRKQAEAELAKAQQLATAATQMQAQFQAILSDPNKLAAVYMAQKAQQTGVPADQQAAPTVPDLNAFAQQMLGQVEQVIAQRFQQLEQTKVATALEQDLRAHADSLIGSHALSRIPGIHDRLFDEVARMGPQSVEQAKEWAGLLAQEWKAAIDSQYAESAKQAAVAKASASAATITGGTPAQPTPKKYTKLDDMETDMMSFLASA